MNGESVNPSPVRCLLLDIEGTTSSISFVYDVMFPFVRDNLAAFLETHWDDSQVADCLSLLADDLGQDSLEQWLGDGAPSDQQHRVANGVLQLMDGDVKATGLKQLQGLIWKDGFHSGEMVAHLFDDVAPAIRAWHQAGLQIRIYSSGSIGAQKLFFGHTVAGNLLPLVSGHYDTTTGPKKEAASYLAIAEDCQIPANQILFVSDVPDELVAADTAGMRTVLSLRPGNHPVGDHDFASVDSFAQIQLND